MKGKLEIGQISDESSGRWKEKNQNELQTSEEETPEESMKPAHVLIKKQH